jgi:hypothetical protein
MTIDERSFRDSKVRNLEQGMKQMFTKTILGATAAAFIAAGSLGASTTTASATGVYIGGNGFYFGYGDYPHGKMVCKPIYKKIKWRDRWGYWHSVVKVVDYKCWWKHRHHDWDDNYNGGYGGDWNGGYGGY